MNWLDIFCFISVSRTRSFSVTARELNISQQAVSRHIGNLEKETGLRLFLRNYHEIHLTKAGERMLQCLVRREHMAKAFKEALRADEEVLHVAWSQWLGCPEPIRESLRSYCEEHPDVTVLSEELEDQEIQYRLTEQRFDLLLTTHFVWNQLKLPTLANTLCEEPVCLLTAKQSFSPDRSDSPEQLFSSDHIPFPHIATPVGNETPDALERRIRKEYAELGLPYSQLEITYNPRSVYINVLLRKGTAFTVSRRLLTQNPRFSLTPLPRTATVMLCRPLRPASQRALELEEYILQRNEVKL